MSIQDIAYQIEHKKLLMSLDNNYEGHLWYEAEIVILQNELKDLLMK
jgi:hypothetical protein